MWHRFGQSQTKGVKHVSHSGIQKTTHLQLKKNHPPKKYSHLNRYTMKQEKKVTNLMIQHFTNRGNIKKWNITPRKLLICWEKKLKTCFNIHMSCSNALNIASLISWLIKSYLYIHMHIYTWSRETPEEEFTSNFFHWQTPYATWPRSQANWPNNESNQLATQRRCQVKPAGGPRSVLPWRRAGVSHSSLANKQWTQLLDQFSYTGSEIISYKHLQYLIAMQCINGGK